MLSPILLDPGPEGNEEEGLRHEKSASLHLTNCTNDLSSHSLKNHGEGLAARYADRNG